MKILRTPDACFAGMPAAHQREITDGLRMAYLDEGPADARTVLLLHGEPSWSYLYRHMIPPILAAGLRVVAPDLIGFGRSDKPAEQSDYTYQRHVDWLGDLVLRELDLRDIVLFCQDWGGLLGLRLVGEHPERFAAVVASNTMLPTGDHDPGAAFKAWRDFSQSVPEFPVGRIVDGGCARSLSEAEIAAYDAPFPDESFKAGARRFPALAPISPDDPAAPANRAAWDGLRAFERPFVCAFGDSDPVTAGADAVLTKLIPGASGQAHETLAGVAHFSQEDAAGRLAEIVIAVAGA